MPEIVDWQTSDPGAVLDRIARAWTAGQIVVLPTEATYEASASALLPAAIRLADLAKDSSPAIVLSSALEARDWLPGLRGLAVRLMRHLPAAQWQLQSQAGTSYGLLQRLPGTVIKVLAGDEFLTVRWPELPLWWQAMSSYRGPIVSAPLPAASAGDAAMLLRHENALIVDGGPCPLGQRPTLVRVVANRWEVRRPGCLSAESVAAAAACRVLFICTGNTCRSPLAAGLLARLLSEQLGCSLPELKERGFLVQSAGLAAMMGDEATPEAVAAARDMGADLSQHRSQPISYELLAQADHVFAMTMSHLYALHGSGLNFASLPQLLSPLGNDVADPLGGEPAVYQACASEILEYLRQRLPAILESA